MTWAIWFSDFDKRRVAESFTELYRVSTVFLGLDHQFGDGPPLIFETMIFERHPHLSRLLDGTLREVFEDLDCWRYSTWDDAVAGHNALTKRYLKLEAGAGDQIRAAFERAGITQPTTEE